MQPQKKRDFYLESRNRVGNQALRLLNQWGQTTTVEILAGGFSALAIALITLIGRDRTQEIFDRLMGENTPPRTKPEIVCLNGERV